MYARKYYLIIYRRNLLPEYPRTSQQQYSRASQQPIAFLCKVTFDLLTFLPFAAYIIFIKFTSFTIHLVHHSPRSPFTFSLSLFHLFLSIFSPFPFPFPSYLPHHSFLSTSQHPGQRLKKNRDNSFVSRKNVLTLQP